MTSRKTSQSMKAATAAKKLGIYLPAAPQEFQEGTITRDEFVELQSNPPQWLADLRRNGPHPRAIVAARLGVSISGLNRNGYSEALTTDEINEIRREEPKWLIIERQIAEEVKAEEERLAKEARIKAEKEARRAKRG
ncbi:DUF5997 family protein [Timonella sp. A28]|uniref:DUF5997 family protein n=1 Tax=Timonella sp. A28 TaxID=3442640 RepID=UPI003EB91B13